MLKEFRTQAFIALILGIALAQSVLWAVPEPATVNTAVQVTAVTAAQTSTVNVAPQFAAVKKAAEKSEEIVSNTGKAPVSESKVSVAEPKLSVAQPKLTIGAKVSRLWQSTGLYHLKSNIGQIVMILVGFLLIWLAIARGFEPLLLLPIGFGGILANIPVADISGPNGLLGMLYSVGIETGVFPLLIFMGVGAMTDFGPLIACPKTALLGAAAQFGIFTTVIGSLAMTKYLGFSYTIKDAAAIGIIGGADGPTAIFLAGRLSPDLLGAIAVAAYSYMALVPIIQPPIMRLLTTPEERAITMHQLRRVRPIEKIVFPLMVLSLCILLLPDATPLIGMLMFGNLLKEAGVVERLSKTASNELINIVTILLGLSVGSKLAADKFLKAETLGILVMGMVAFAIGTAAGVLLAKLMNRFSKEPINPLIGAAGVSAVPMAARVVNKVGLEANPHNFLIMHAMGPNVAGVIGSAVAAGVLLALCS
jgi:oxaloacetate decarboxylase beta subunit